MMTSSEIREKFKSFFESKSHKIVASSPMVIKDDPSLMFTNAGMNQFKDIFLGNSEIKNPRVANSQKCLRVSGKHNDLDEVGHDTYHHTMFEMLGNWSFGDYFKKEAIQYAWEFLTDLMQIPEDRLYVTVFEGSKEDHLGVDEEAKKYWLEHVSEDYILLGNKKDNFWEMGDTGPCGPCSEVHVDIRPDHERKKMDGKELVNKDHPQVIEIWNLVFIQFNRKADGSLEPLPNKHIDTGMGFERLCMVLQNKTSNYDTDVFQPIIQKIAGISGIPYGHAEDTDIAMRVIADHLRAIAFSITDGQLPSNTGAGYVIRRILRRAVRYAYNFLNIKEAFLKEVYPVLIDVMGEAFPELNKQKELASKVITEEENSFLRTLATGNKLLDEIICQAKENETSTINGKQAFELYDTYGFPFDLTELILAENNLKVNKKQFDEEMNKQKSRSRSAATTKTDDWVRIWDDEKEEFIGYDYTHTDIKITRYRKVQVKNKDLYQLVFNYTPFYPEGGGQIGDKGYIQADEEKISIIDTKKENQIIIHITDKLPKDPKLTYKAFVNESKRRDTARNHTATHLMHHALRKVLGKHVEQKGSLVQPDYLRFDFSHFEKMTEEEILQVEDMVNELIRNNFKIEEHRATPFTEAQKMGAIALFGEKYGDLVRVIKFGDSVELCGGTHVKASGEIAYFKIVTESSIAAGIRRIEAYTGRKADELIKKQFQLGKELSLLFKTNKNIPEQVKALIQEKEKLTKDLEKFAKEQLKSVKQEYKKQIIEKEHFNLLALKTDLSDAGQIKDLAFQLKAEIEKLIFIVGAEINGKANFSIMINDELVKNYGLHAGNLIREAAREIKGGGGGQAFYATAGGADPNGIQNAINKAIELIDKQINQ